MITIKRYSRFLFSSSCLLATQRCLNSLNNQTIGNITGADSMASNTISNLKFPNWDPQNGSGKQIE